MYTVTIYTKDGCKNSVTLAHKWEALRLCREETKWEGTIRVICLELGFDEEGSFT